MIFSVVRNFRITCEVPVLLTLLFYYDLLSEWHRKSNSKDNNAAIKKHSKENQMETEIKKMQYKIRIDHDEIDQNWQDETTNYWFTVTGHEYIADGKYALSDHNGEVSFLDCDGFPVDQRIIGHLEMLSLNQSYWD